ncbi:Tox-REase-5 domain-containing protein [Melittangium boletus]|uniref:Tox-REase-5 domain-containing protein n=1 Tax=Melittangium boletus DSM 14713 TaxID=1294270 RepID=A0A250IE09_9BACT|nr:Tox-REase-5 domain-containing protein [Melittangium boletus]ATB30079.1 hypothetical protein MEBOL_003534 [Melittangium boletus DSM 14713]
MFRREGHFQRAAARLALVLVLVATMEARAAPADDVQHLLEHAGLPGHAHLSQGMPLTPDRAQALWLGLLDSTPTARSFAPRTVLARLLRDALASGQSLPYATLRTQAERFRRLVVVRPDGYACVALTGAPLAPLGRPVQREGQLHVQLLRVGAFYFDEAGVFFAVDESLRPQGLPLGEVPLARDPATAALLGAQDAVEQMARALAEFLTHPVRSLDGLRQLPSALAGLIASSPEYFARYGAMNLETQIREASRLAAHLLTLEAGLASQGARMAGAARLPVLSLSARGELVTRVVAVPSGARISTLGAGAASASLVFMAQGSPLSGNSSWTPPSGGPGQWIQKPEAMSDEARRYQSQVTGAPEGWVYRVRTGPGPRDFVDFDGFRDGVLLETKGPGYQELLRKMHGKEWFDGLNGMIGQAQRQLRASGGLPIHWHFAERSVANLMSRLLKERGHGRIKIIPPPSPH